MEKISPYIRYAHGMLIREGKYTTLELNTRKIKVFEPADVWEKILDFADKVKAMKND